MYNFSCVPFRGPPMVRKGLRKGKSGKNSKLSYLTGLTLNKKNNSTFLSSTLWVQENEVPLFLWSDIREIWGFCYFVTCEGLLVFSWINKMTMTHQSTFLLACMSRNMCTQLWGSSIFFSHFEDFPVWKWKKCDNLSRQAQCDTTCLFHYFFPFQSGNALKWSSLGQKWSKYPFFTPGGQNMQIRKKWII